MVASAFEHGHYMGPGIASHAAEWEQNAQRDPLFAILTSPHGRGGKWDHDDFFKTGEGEIATLFSHLGSIGALPETPNSFLEFGCGVGRTSRALIKRFARGTGLDISSTMVGLAKEYSADDARRTEYRVHQAEDLGQVPAGTVSFVYCHIVLQHMPARLQKTFIGEFVRMLEPGGVTAFQIPIAQLPSTAINLKALIPVAIKDRLKKLVGRGSSNGVSFEMNCLAAEEIDQAIKVHGGEIISIAFSNSTESDYHGRLELFDRDVAVERVRSGRAKSHYLSAFYFVRRPPQ